MESKELEFRISNGIKFMGGKPDLFLYLGGYDGSQFDGNEISGIEVVNTNYTPNYPLTDPVCLFLPAWRDNTHNVFPYPNFYKGWEQNYE